MRSQQTGALGIDSVIKRAVAIEGDAHLSAEFPIDFLDTAFAFAELLVYLNTEGQ